MKGAWFYLAVLVVAAGIPSWGAYYSRREHWGSAMCATGNCETKIRAYRHFPSFPRKRESSEQNVRLTFRLQRFFWVPAYTGTTVSFSKCQHTLARSSRFRQSDGRCSDCRLGRVGQALTNCSQAPNRRRWPALIIHRHLRYAAIPNSRSLASRYSCERPPLTLLRWSHSSCRFSMWPIPPRLSGMIWSMVRLRRGNSLRHPLRRLSCWPNSTCLFWR